MTATGIVFFVVGFLIVKFLGSPYLNPELYNFADQFGIAVAEVGLLLIFFGAVKYLWDMLP